MFIHFRAFSTLLLFTSMLFASPKVTLGNTMQLKYQTLPKSVDELGHFFDEGLWYGRLRSNTFVYNKDNNDHYTTGLGGSLVYKSAYYHGLGLTLGVYTTFNPVHMDDSKASQYRPGKGVMSRYDVLTQSDYSMTVLAQAYIEYKNFKSSLKIGRMLFESLFTKSNDTKMIPNAFEGVSFESHYFDKTALKLAYFERMKLRDHASFHHVLAYGENLSDPYAKYTQNDDAGMHRGLTQSRLTQMGIDPKLMIVQIKNSSIKDLLIHLNYSTVPDLIALASIEAQYTFGLDTLKILPAFRYIAQIDKGAGAIGGASIKNNTLGYTHPNSMESWLFAGRVDIHSEGAWKLRFGYSKVADKADILAPWRGFPTGGYTRAMTQYNWFANTTTYMIRADYDLGRVGIMDNTKIFMRYAIHDFDDEKAGLQADNHTWTLDILKQFRPNFYAKTRMGINRGESDIVTSDGRIKADPSYNEIRFELNYLF